jgi:hypothetical protein
MSSKSPKVAIVDYEMGNPFSVKRACENFGMVAEITPTYDAIESADAVILPVASAFGKRERKIRIRLLESSPLIHKSRRYRLCRDCAEICLWHEDACPNRSSKDILNAGYPMILMIFAMNALGASFGMIIFKNRGYNRLPS